MCKQDVLLHFIQKEMKKNIPKTWMIKITKTIRKDYYNERSEGNRQ
jgi:hypothetical protein